MITEAVTALVGEKTVARACESGIDGQKLARVLASVVMQQNQNGLGMIVLQENDGPTTVDVADWSPKPSDTNRADP